MPMPLANGAVCVALVLWFELPCNYSSDNHRRHISTSSAPHQCLVNASSLSHHTPSHPIIPHQHLITPHEHLMNTSLITPHHTSSRLIKPHHTSSRLIKRITPHQTTSLLITPDIKRITPHHAASRLRPPIASSSALLARRCAPTSLAMDPSNGSHMCQAVGGSSFHGNVADTER